MGLQTVFRNPLINVSSIEKEVTPESHEFDSFGKLVLKGETGDTLDTIISYLKEIVSGIESK